MSRPLLGDAFGHHVWASTRVFDVCAALEPAQLDTTVPGTYGSIIDTLRHLVGGDCGYLVALTGGRTPEIDEDHMDLAALRAQIEANGPEWAAIVAQDIDPDADVIRHRDDGTDSHAPLGIRLAQALHHGTDHRSQICTALTTLGIEPPPIDVWDFADQDGRAHGDAGRNLTGREDPSMQADDGHFKEQVASAYDESADRMFDPAVVGPTVDFLAELAKDGPALELGIGTGRIAIPLAARGVEVQGIDLSRPMTDRLRAKPGAEGIAITIGDFSTAKVGGSFRLVYLVFNTIMNVTSQAGQVATFRNAAAHLVPGGSFVIETGVPDLRRLPPGERFVVFDGSETHWGIDEYDVANQGLISHHFEVREGTVEKSSGPFRYVWPAELDLMAELAGLRLHDRWSSWAREPFTSDSRSHVSVWGKPGG